MSFQIDDNVPLPETQTYRAKYPLREMSPGQSFFVPTGEAHRVQTAVSAMGRRSKLKFTTRQLTENGVAGVRVWRLA